MLLSILLIMPLRYSRCFLVLAYCMNRTPRLASTMLLLLSKRNREGTDKDLNGLTSPWRLTHRSNLILCPHNTWHRLRFSLWFFCPGTISGAFSWHNLFWRLAPVGGLSSPAQHLQKQVYGKHLRTQHTLPLQRKTFFLEKCLQCTG